MVHVDSVSKRYEVGKAIFVALNRVSFFAPPVAITLIQGPHHAGKTVLLNLIAGIESPTSGHIRINKFDLTAAPPSLVNQHRRTQVGFVAEPPRLLAGATPIEIVEQPALFAGIPEMPRLSMVKAALQFVGLPESINREKKLLALDQQRVACARAILFDPPVFLADNPFGQLNTDEAVIVAGILRRLANQGKTVIVASRVTGNTLLEQQADQVIHLRRGSLSSQ